MSRFGTKKTDAGIVTAFGTRIFRMGGRSVAAAGIVLAVAVLANVLINALPAELTMIDTTASQMFSISDQTKQIVSGLDREVSIYWVTPDGGQDDAIGTLLDRYKSMSRNITVEQRDPSVYPTFIEQYTDSYNNNSLVVVSGERYRYVDYYEIYEYEYSGSYYDYSVSDVKFAGESVLTSAISYVVSDNIPKLYLLTGHGEAELPAGYADAVNKENIETAQLSLLTLEAVPEDADAIAICAPQSDISQTEQDMLRAYLQAGGKLFLVSGPLQEGSLTNLEALMADYGVSAQQGVVVEGSQNHYLWGRPYFLLPQLGSHAIVDPLSQSGYRVLLPIAQGLSVDEQLRSGLSVTALATTSDSAFSKTAGYALTTYEKEQGDVDGPFALAVAITEGDTQIVWVSSAMLLDEQTNSQISGGNLDVFLNGLNWMCEKDESTLSIRNKSLARANLTIDSGTAMLLTLVVVAVIPLSYLGIGVFQWVRRRRR